MLQQDKPTAGCARALARGDASRRYLAAAGYRADLRAVTAQSRRRDRRRQRSRARCERAKQKISKRIGNRNGATGDCKLGPAVTFSKLARSLSTYHGIRRICGARV